MGSLVSVLVANGALVRLRRRERNGQPQRGTADERRQAFTREEEATKAQVALQPHRRGERSDKAHTPWQRLIASGRVRDGRTGGFTGGELEEAGKAFARVLGRYRAILDGHRPYAVTDGIGGRQLSAGQVKDRREEWVKVQEVLRDAGSRALQAMMFAVDSHTEAEERLWERDLVEGIRLGLIALARHFQR